LNDQFCSPLQPVSSQSQSVGKSSHTTEQAIITMIIKLTQS
jgi:hypothetical protein